ncbi:MAG: GNAT family N-acetyltransferase [Actinomycetota bacterium]
MSEVYEAGDIRATADPAAYANTASGAPVADDAPIEIRSLEPHEAIDLCEAIWRSYGPSYDSDWVYRPAEVAERLRRGALRSIVGISEDDEVVGHVGCTLTGGDANVGEAGQAVVDPRWRGHHLFTTLKRTLADRMRADGFAGIFSEATAAHPYSQKANVELGAQETGILVGYIPASVDYRAIEEGPAHRRSVVVYYLKLNDGPERPIYAPPRHRGVIDAITRRAALHGRVAVADRAGSDATVLTEQIRSDHNAAFVSIERTGPDLAEAVGRRLEQERARRLDCVYVDLPLDDPGTQSYGDDLARLGFFFGGLFPNRRQTGDVLRLQFLNDLQADVRDIQLASDAGRDLLEYVLDEDRDGSRHGDMD